MATQAPSRRKPPRVLSVGQCGFDNGSIAAFLKRTFGAEMASADTADEAIDSVRSGGFALVLVNRILDADGSSGLELVRALNEPDNPDAAPAPPVMLVSNYPEARQQAEALGALPGFGKAELLAPKAELLDRLRTVLSGGAPASG